MSTDMRQIRGQWSEVRRAALVTALAADDWYATLVGARLTEGGLTVPSDAPQCLDAFTEAISNLNAAVNAAEAALP